MKTSDIFSLSTDPFDEDQQKHDPQSRVKYLEDYVSQLYEHVFHLQELYTRFRSRFYTRYKFAITAPSNWPHPVPKASAGNIAVYLVPSQINVAKMEYDEKTIRFFDEYQHLVGPFVRRCKQFVNAINHACEMWAKADGMLKRAQAEAERLERNETAAALKKQRKSDRQ
jgi:hypothetical protein